MSFKDGDFVRVEYSAWRGSDGSLAYTTEKSVAEKNGVSTEGNTYGPRLIIMGKNTIITGAEKAIAGMNVNETKKVEISPDEAFGQRDPGLVRVMHVSDFRRRDIEPRAGMQVDLDGTIATITSVNSGRVTVDLNHVLAGERLTYEIKVVEKVDSVDKKVEALAKMSNLSPDSAKVSANSAEILFGDKTEKDANYFINKSAFVTSVFRYLPEISKVQVREEYAKKDGEGSVSEKQ